MAQYGTAWVDVRGDTSGLVNDISSATRNAAGRLGGVGKTVLGDLGRIGTQTAAVVAAASTAAAVSLGKIGIEYNTLEQSSLAAFKTLLGTEEAAKRMQADLREFASTSPFPRQAFISGTQQLLSFGMEAKKVIPTLDAIQQAVAATGGSGQDLSEIVRVLAKVQGTGKITALTLNELGIRGVNAAKLIGDQMGQTENEIRDSITAGALGGEDALDALVAGMQERFGGAAEGLKETWIGATDRVKAAWRDIASDLVEPFVSKGGGGAGVEWANEIADSMRKLQKNVVPLLVPIVESIGDGFGRAADRASDLVQSLNPIGVARRLNRVISMVDKTRKSLEGAEGVAIGVGVAIAGIGARSVLGPLGFLVPAISPITGALVGLVAGSEEGRDAIAGMGDKAAEFAKGAGQDLLRGVGDLADELTGPVSRALESVFSALVDAGSNAVPALVDAFETLGPPLGELIESAGELAAAVLPALVDIVATALPVAIVPLGAAFEAAAIGAQFLADNAWLVVPALSAIAAVKLVNTIGRMAPAFSALAVGLRDFSTYYGVLRAEGGGVARSLSGAAGASTGLGGALAGILNPAVVGVTAAIAVGGFALKAYSDHQRDVRESADALSDSLGQTAAAFRSDQTARALKDLEPSLDTINDLKLSLTDLSDLAVSLSRDELRQMSANLATAFNEMGTAYQGEEAIQRFRDSLEYLPDDVRQFGIALAEAIDSGNISMGSAQDLLTDLATLSESTGKSMKESRAEYTALAREALEAGDITATAFQRISDAIANAETPTEMNAAVYELINLLGGGGLQGEVEAAALSIDDANAMLDRFGGAARDAGTAADDAAGDVTLTAESLDGLKQSADEAKVSIQNLLVELFELQGSERAVAAGERATRDAINRLVEQVAGAREGIDKAQSALAEAQASEDTERIARAAADLQKAQLEALKWAPTGDEVAGAMQSIVEAAEGQADALAKVDTGGTRTREMFEGLVAQLVALRDQGILPAGDEFNRLLELFQLTPTDIETRVKIATDEAAATLAELQETLNAKVPDGELKAEVQVLLDQGRLDEAIAKMQQIPGVLDAEIATVEAHADEMGIQTTEWQLNWLARERESWVKVQVDDTEARARLDALARHMSTLPGWLGFDPSRISPGFGVRGGRASGGPVTPGWWMVGERGPELLHMPRSGHVFNAEQTTQMLDKSQTGGQFTDAHIDRLIDALAERNLMDITVNADSADGRRIGLDVSDALWLRGH